MNTTTINTKADLSQLLAAVEKANSFYAENMEKVSEKGLQKDQYMRFLRMQYHLTKGVQNTFLGIASHSETRPYKKLRKFLVNFAYEEEMHYKLAEKDLQRLGGTPEATPFPVELWWQYQKYVVQHKPLERLGATAVLENIGNYAAPIIKKMFAEANYINSQNTSFATVHMHEELPHGDQILDALSAENFSQNHLSQLNEGARRATWLYASVIYQWIMNGELKPIPFFS